MGGGGICTYTLYKYLCKSSRCSLVKLFDQIISTNMIDLNYFNMIINIFLIYTILQSFYHRHSHYWLEISKVALLILLNQHKFCQTFLKLKKSSNIFKYLIQSICANILAQKLDKLFNKAVYSLSNIFKLFILISLHEHIVRIFV